MTDADFEQLIGPYLAGELDGESAARMRAYLEETPGRQGFVAGIRGAVRSEDVGVAPEVEASRRRLVERLGREAGEVVEGRLKGRRAKNVVGRGGRGMGILRTQTLRQALVGMAMLVAVVALLFRRAPETHHDVTRVYATTAHQQADVVLSDGTRMTLAPQTTLRVQHFGRQSRTVVLEGGEAYFQVAHTTGLPFIVRSGTTTTQVLGTAFLVRYHAGDSHVHVAVTDGKVQLVTSARSDAGLTLTAGQVGDVTDSTMQSTSADELAPSAEWETGRVVFRHTPVATVLRTLSQWYGYQFRYADRALGARSVTIVVSTRSSAEALATIEQLLAVNVTVAGDTITLVPQVPRASQSVPRVRTYDVWTPNKEAGR